MSPARAIPPPLAAALLFALAAAFHGVPAAAQETVRVPLGAADAPVAAEDGAAPQRVAPAALGAAAPGVPAPGAEGESPPPPPGDWDDEEGEEEEEREEEALPTGHPITRYAGIWEDSPFLRELVRPAETIVASTFGRDLVLEGLVDDRRSGPVAYVRDKGRGKDENPILVILTEEQAGVPYRIESAEINRDPTQSQVVITDGKDKITLRFAENLLTQSIAPAPAADPSLQPRETSALTPGAAAQAVAKGARHPRQIPPGDASASADADADADPASNLDKLDADPRRRRIMLPGGGSAQN